ncbi:MAG: ABC transporter permease [Tannerellaceae bacterium]|nr:ABC transporter permease [Tannerellaceae bacterium]
MLKHYFKQVWVLIRQEKLFSGIYIAGTGLSVAVVMVLSILLYVELANIYPETNRDRLLYVKYAAIKSGESMSSSGLSYHTIEQCFRNMETVEAVTATLDTWGEDYFVQVDGQKENIQVDVKYVDDAWWKVFPLVFRSGAPFTAADHQSGLLTVVINQSLARKVFGDTDAVGKYLTLNLRPYRICGVVKDVPVIMKNTYANVWIPYTVNPDYKDSFAEHGILGSMNVTLLAPSSGSVQSVQEEARENLRKYDSTFENVEFLTMGQPDRHWQLLFRDYWGEGDYLTGWILAGFVFLIVLLIPSVSLSGMVDSRMERRMSELGIRRAFGAPAGLLLRQIIYENFFFTLFGGMAGLIFSYLFIYLGRELVFMWTSDFSIVPVEATRIFSPEMLFNFPVFLISLFICLILNILSATIPAWRASRREIVYSLNSK